MTGVQFYRDEDLPFFELKICDANRLCYKKHSHEEYSMGVVDEGNSTFWYGGKNIEVNCQTIVLIPPGLVHSCNPQPHDQWKYKMLFIEVDWMERFLKNKGLPAFYQPVVSDKVKANSCKALDKMLAHLTFPASLLEKEAAVIAFFDQAVQGIGKINEANEIKELPKLVAIKQYIHDNYRQKITLEKLEQVSGLNKFNIIRSFKEEFNIPPHMYQTLLRVNDAKKMLRKHRQIIEVAYETGFYDQSHFHKVFKSQTGVTPERYQSCGG